MFINVNQQRVNESPTLTIDQLAMKILINSNILATAILGTLDSETSTLLPIC